MRSKKFLLFIGFFVIALITFVWMGRYHKHPTVKVGILHSLSGTMAISETSVANVSIAAFAEINENGGILGHTIVPVLSDGKSDPRTFAEEAETLIEVEKVKALFGCWTSSSRKEVQRIIEKHDHLLFYPVQYEGFEASANIIYLGQVPNQQIRPAIKYAIDHFGTEFALVGSDYIFPHAANLYIKDMSAILGLQLRGEYYVKLGGRDFKTIVERIKKDPPRVIFNTLNGDSNLYFFRELYRQGIRASHIPVISFSIGDTEVQQMGKSLPPDALVGHYASRSYFSSLDSSKNRAFKNFLKKYRIDAVATDAMEAAYNGIQMYKQAVEECRSFEPYIVRRYIPMQSFEGAGGIIYIDPRNNHAWKNSRIAQLNRALTFDIVYDSSALIEPQNYPSYKSVQEWNDQMNQFYIPLSR
jgi:urea transport system substrate-binding protein